MLSFSTELFHSYKIQQSWVQRECDLLNCLNSNFDCGCPNTPVTSPGLAAVTKGQHAVCYNIT